MKILQIVPEMKMGGVETGTLDLARTLVERGHTALVISAGGPLVKSLEEAGARHIALSVHRKNPWKIWYLSKIVRKIIRDEGVDIVHARSRVPAWVGFLAVRGTRARFLTTAHGYYRPHWGSRVMGWGEKVIAISQSVQKHLIDNFHVFPDRIRLIHRGVDLKRFTFHPRPVNLNSLRIGIVGRITPLKGHDVFIKAMSGVVKIFPSAKGIIVGDAPASRAEYFSELVNLVETLGVKDRIEFRSGTENIQDVFKELDLLVLATTTPEAFGRVIIEAQAMGVPVIATRVGGVVDIIEDGKNGWLVPPSDPESLSEKIVNTFKSPDEIQGIVSEARKRVEKSFSLDRMVDKTLEVYQELMKSPKILVVKMSALGDIILASPTFRALRKTYTNAEISLLVQKSYLELVKSCPYLDCCISMTKDKKGRISNFMRLLHEIRLRRFDVFLDLQNNKISHWVGFLSRIPKRIGYARGGRFFMLTDRLRYQPEGGPVESQNRLLALMGVVNKDTALEFWTKKEDEVWIKDLLIKKGIKQDEPLIALFPFSNVRWQTKRWGLENFIELARQIASGGHVPVFIGGSEDFSFNEELGKIHDFRFISLIAETNMGQLAELLKRCRVLVTGDSAPLHVGAAVKTATVALFGPTDFRRHVPPGPVKAMAHSVPCAPCYSPVCKIKTHDCLRLITVDEVFKEVMKIIENG